MQNKGKLEDKISLGNMGRMLPPLFLPSFISLHSFIEDLSSFSSFWQWFPWSSFWQKIKECSPFHRNHCLSRSGNLKPRFVFFSKTKTKTKTETSQKYLSLLATDGTFSNFMPSPYDPLQKREIERERERSLSTRKKKW